MKGLAVLLVAGLAFAQGPPKPPDLTPDQKLDIVRHVSKLRAGELEKQRLRQQYEQKLQQARDQIVKELQQAVNQVDINIGMDAKALTEKLKNIRSVPGWQISDTGEWVQDSSTGSVTADSVVDRVTPKTDVTAGPAVGPVAPVPPKPVASPQGREERKR